MNARMIFMAVLVVLGLSGSTLIADVNDGLISNWRFDEGSGAIVYDSAGTNDGTISGATWTTGIIDGALDFDGLDDYVTVPYDNSLDIRSEISFSSWIYVNDTTGDYQTIISRWFPGYAYAFDIQANGKTVQMVLSDIIYPAASDTDIEFNRWFHVAATYDGAFAKIYINGEETGSYVASGLILSTTAPLLIGAHDSVPDRNPFNGSIDDVRIYDRALSALEIEELYNSVPVPPVGETYHVDDVNGDNTNDGLTPETAFKTIQRGINVAEDYDTVLVWPGQYSGPVYIVDKAITVTSADDPAVIDGGFDDAVAFYSWENKEATLKNFILQNGYAGVYVDSGQPVLSNLTIVDCFTGIEAETGADPDISNCIFWGNNYGDLFRDPVPLQAEYSFVQEKFENGLVAHWKLDGDATDSAGNNDGTIVGDPCWVAGKVGDYALDIDDYGEYVALPDNNPVWLPQDNFAISMWILFNPIGTDYVSIFDLDGAASGSPYNRMGLFIERYFDRTLRVLMVTGTGYLDELTSETALDNEKWHHIVWFRSGTTHGIYLDRILDTSTTCSDEPIDYTGIYNDDKVQIARSSRPGEPVGYSIFKIDEVAIYDRALTPEEIELMYEAGLAGHSYSEPGFADANNGDYHLLSERGRYWPEHDVWVLDNVTSPCVDGGDPAVDPADEPMPNGGRINMGAYGNTAYASMSEWPLKHDSNFDGIVNMLDLARLAQEWLQGVAATSPPPPPPPPPPPLPGQASNPNPADSATNVDRDADLSWTPGSDAYSHDVYFGTSSPGTFRGNEAVATFEPGTMPYVTTYYWRIDEVNASGTTTGIVWNFTTKAGPPPPPIPP